MNAEVAKDNKLEFPVLTDAGHGYAKQLALDFTLPEDLQAIYTAWGVVLPTFNGDDSWQLPLPARVVINQDGRLRHIAADPDYTVRPDPQETIDILKQ